MEEHIVSSLLLGPPENSSRLVLSDILWAGVSSLLSAPPEFSQLVFSGALGPPVARQLRPAVISVLGGGWRFRSVVPSQQEEERLELGTWKSEESRIWV